MLLEFCCAWQYRIHFADPKDGGRLAASNQQVGSVSPAGEDITGIRCAVLLQ